MREIVMELAFAYPEMFRARDVNTEGKRLVDKEADQARKLCDRVSLLHLEGIIIELCVSSGREAEGWLGNSLASLSRSPVSHPRSL